MVSAEAAGSVEVAVRDLAIRYGDKTVLSDVSLDVRTNEIFGIIGPANSGKTSFPVSYTHLTLPTIYSV